MMADAPGGLPLPDEAGQDTRAKRLSIQLVDAAAGAQKTRSLIAYLADKHVAGETLHMMVASPTTKLAGQTARGLVEAGVPQHAVKIITHETSKKTVRMQLQAVLQKTRPDDSMVILCTHAAMQLDRPNLTEQVDDPRDLEAAKREGRKPKQTERVIWDPKEWDLTWDEAPEILAFENTPVPSLQWTWGAFVEAVPDKEFDRVVELKPRRDWDDRQYERSEAPFGTNRDGEAYMPVDMLQFWSRNKPHDCMIAPVSKLLGAIAAPHKRVLVSKEQWLDLTENRFGTKDADGYMYGTLDSLVVTDPQHFGDFRSQTILGARLMDTMAVVLWDRLWGFDSLPHPIAAGLPKDHSTKRLTVHYVFESPVSRTWLMQRDTEGRTLFQAACLGIAKHLQSLKKGKAGDSEKPWWNAPLPGVDKDHGVAADFFAPLAHQHKVDDWLPRDHRLPGKVHGRNDWLAVHRMVLVNVLKFSPPQYDLLLRIGLTDLQIERAFAYNENYQSAMRTNLRVADGVTFPAVLFGKQHKVTGEGNVGLWVLDKVAAEDLLRSFPNAPESALRQIPKAFVPEAAPPKANSGEERPEGWETWTERQKSAWRSKQYRARMRSGTAQQSDKRERRNSRNAEADATTEE